MVFDEMFKGWDIVSIIASINIWFNIGPELGHAFQCSIVLIQQDVGVHAQIKFVSTVALASRVTIAQVYVQYPPILTINLLSPL